jgi:hypothetical protein
MPGCGHPSPSSLCCQAPPAAARARLARRPSRPSRGPTPACLSADSSLRFSLCSSSSESCCFSCFPRPGTWWVLHAPSSSFSVSCSSGIAKFETNPTKWAPRTWSGKPRRLSPAATQTAKCASQVRSGQHDARAGQTRAPLSESLAWTGSPSSSSPQPTAMSISGRTRTSRRIPGSRDQRCLRSYRCKTPHARSPCHGPPETNHEGHMTPPAQ